MAISQKLLEKLRTLITMPRHKPKVMAPEGMQWEPMGIEPLMDIDGTGRNFCTAPRDVHFNTADKINRSRDQSNNPPDDTDPWSGAMSDPNGILDRIYGSPSVPPPITGPDDPRYIRNQRLGRSTANRNNAAYKPPRDE